MAIRLQQHRLPLPPACAGTEPFWGLRSATAARTRIPHIDDRRSAACPEHPDAGGRPPGHLAAAGARGARCRILSAGGAPSMSDGMSDGRYAYTCRGAGRGQPPFGCCR